MYVNIIGKQILFKKWIRIWIEYTFPGNPNFLKQLSFFFISLSLGTLIQKFFEGPKNVCSNNIQSGVWKDYHSNFARRTEQGKFWKFPLLNEEIKILL